MVFLALVVLFLTLAPPVLAIETGLGFGTITGLGTQDIRITIMKIVRIILGFVGVIAISIIIYAGYIWMTSAGNSERIEKAKKILIGAPVGAKIASGKAHIILDAKQINQFKPGEVLVTDMTDPDWEPIMKIASGIITNRGGRTCHAAIVSRELGVPAIVGASNVRKLLKNNQSVTVSCAEGDEGHIYNTILPFEVKKIEIKNIKKTKI